MYRDDSGIFSLVIKWFGITNTTVQNFAIRISSVETVPIFFAETESFFFTNLIYTLQKKFCTTPSYFSVF